MPTLESELEQMCAEWKKTALEMIAKCEVGSRSEMVNRMLYAYTLVLLLDRPMEGVKVRKKDNEDANLACSSRRQIVSPDLATACPLCELIPEYFVASLNSGRTSEVHCPRCGKYRISDQAIEALPPREKYLLSYVCRTWSSDTVPEILTSNIQDYIRRAPVRGVPEKLDWLLEMYAKHTSEIGKASEFRLDRDFPLIAAQGFSEAALLKRTLADRMFIEDDRTGAIVTVSGWERFERFRQSGPNSAFVFVAMSFSHELAELFDKAIGPAVTRAGYKPIRVDRKEHTNSIDDEIIGNIRKSRFMVADFTEQRAGVYFEAGMMAGLGRTVVWMCNKTELSKVHFDVRQRNFIDWENFDDARERLHKRILAIEGEGPTSG